MTDETIQLQTPSKINLTLAILNRRPDGFHELESWVAPIGLFDRLSVSPAASLELVIHGAENELTVDSSNLIWLAATALASAAGLKPAARIELQKNIPIGAGLGGGSSDAAATLLALNRLWQLDWPVERLAPIAESLGSDVTFFLQPGAAVLRGRGERVEHLGANTHRWVALIVPPFGLSTAAVYAAYAAHPTHRESVARPWTETNTSSADLMSRLFNDLESAAFACEPRLGALHAALNGLDGRPVRMTGSGSGLFTVFDGRDQAASWAKQAQTRLPPNAASHIVETL